MIRPVGGAPLRLENYGGSFDIDYGSQAASASATVRLPSDGRYEISGDPGPTRGASVVLGKPTLKPALIFAASAGLALLVIIGVIVVIILAVVLPRKDEDDDGARCRPRHRQGTSPSTRADCYLTGDCSDWRSMCQAASFGSR